MRVIVYHTDGRDATHDMVLGAFYDGCPCPKSWRPVEDYEPSDVAVVFGVAKRAVPLSAYRGYVISEQLMTHRKQVIVLETGYVHRGDGGDNHYAAGLGGLNGRADFRNWHSPPDRVPCKVHPWRWTDPEKCVLLCGQVPWDASVEHVCIEEWLGKTLECLRHFTPRRIVYRPHPKAPACMPVPDAGIEVSTAPVDWDKVHAAVTFNSNMGVDATIAGVPAFVDDIGSMALPVANRKLELIERPMMLNRYQWIQDLGYCQWTPAEMRRGDAWRHLMSWSPQP